MPYNALMQSASTLFASVMAVVVVAFPTPRDLRDTMFPPAPDHNVEIVSGGLPVSLPEAASSISPDELKSALDTCVDSLGAAVPFGLETCRDTIQLASYAISRNPEMAVVEEKLDLATAYYCRVEWVKSNTDGHGFDLKTCEGIAVALAD